MWPFTSVSKETNDALISVLTEVSQRLSEHDNISWEGLSPAEASMDLDIAIEQLREKRKVDYRNLRMLFAPTGLIQECAIANGWGDQFLRFAEQVDEELRRKG